MLKKDTFLKDKPQLQDLYWPPVNFYQINQLLHNYLTTNTSLEEFIANEKRYDKIGEKLNIALSEIYAYMYGYKDSILFQRQNKDLDILILTKKIEVEEYFLHNWLNIEKFPDTSFLNQEDLAIYFEEESINSEGMHHSFFDFIADEMDREAMIHFLKTEICRNEYVDDEVALLTVGLQGNMKKVSASNLWDECGCGLLQNFHTYWLRRLMLNITDYESFLDWRLTKPWQFSLTSNIFNCLLSNPALKLAAYGCFTTTEQWVECHFNKIIKGMRRVGLCSGDALVYFEKHKTIDPHHTEELVQAIRFQSPRLTKEELAIIHKGSLLAIKVAVLAYDRMLDFYTKNSNFN
mgnify:CR=1 FL=1|jgi:hypothetical protein